MVILWPKNNTNRFGEKLDFNFITRLAGEHSLVSALVSGCEDPRFESQDLQSLFRNFSYIQWRAVVPRQCRNLGLGPDHGTQSRGTVGTVTKISDSPRLGSSAHIFYIGYAIF